HRWRVAMPLMASISAGSAARVPRLTLRDGDTAGRGLARLLATDLPGAPVVGAGQELRGTVSRARLESADPATPLGQLLDGSGPSIAADDGLDDALGTLHDGHVGWAPVTGGGRLIGILSAGDAMQAYRRALAGNVRQVRRMGGGSIVEARLGARSPVVGRTVADAGLPRSVVLVAIQRDEELVIPRGETVLAAGDIVSVFSARGQDDDELRAIIEGHNPISE
ncbi:MAG TPA: TrkA C-terminal domain-containing protein, partial [Candidatus Limnocylindria bacterium]|nr:TrkA C-terminal domain-containing protein [Candidatus Limnocylindria bacterium]